MIRINDDDQIDDDNYYHDYNDDYHGDYGQHLKGSSSGLTSQSIIMINYDKRNHFITVTL